MTYGNYPDLKQVKRILVVKMRHHGDVLLTSTLFSELKRAAPHAADDDSLLRQIMKRPDHRVPARTVHFNQIRLGRQFRARGVHAQMNLMAQSFANARIFMFRRWPCHTEPLPYLKPDDKPS